MPSARLANARTRTKKRTARSVGGRKSAPSSAQDRFVYAFANGKADGDGSMRDLLGGKGANLAEMTSIGLPVPPGFTISTRACERFYAAGERLPDGLMREARQAMRALERATGKRFGDADNPLLVSVRSGAAVSMPGMMDTVLNLGLSDEVVEGIARQTSNRRFALDAYRRLINMFGDVVMGVPHERFEEAFDTVKQRYDAANDASVPTEGLEELCDAYKRVFEGSVGRPFPQDPEEQLEKAIEAVFRSWNTPRAVRYRRINEIAGLRGTAVNVQTMVFGNMGEDSATGVAFTRDPSTGENRFFGEFLVNAQGEDVVAGIRTPRPVAEMQAWNSGVFDQLLDIKRILEDHYRDMQDIEFTIERGELFMLQTRTGKRTARSALRIARDMVREKRIDRNEALLRIPASDLTQLLLPSFGHGAKRRATLLTRGLPASPGVAVGKPAFTAEEAVRRADEGERIILVRRETSPEDIDGMHKASGILTSTGGMTSHAAVVARGWGKCCVAGAGEMQINSDEGAVHVAGKRFDRDSVLSIDGSTGEVFEGAVETEPPQISDDFATVMKWADARRRLRVRANADAPHDAQRAREFGAEGIGLCRTEHMFFGDDRIRAMRRMILSGSREEREAALADLLPLQREDFTGIFEAMHGLPVTIRLLDPPLHEFLPQDEDALRELASAMDIDEGDLRRRVQALREANPMLGHRGCRLAVSFPEVLVTQTRAIVEAAIECAERGVDARPEIMVPLVAIDLELETLRARIEETLEAVRGERGVSAMDIPIGVMIETPRAAITAGAVAAHADFFSFGTNDLTQMTFGFSRDDIGSFLPAYLDAELLPADPFQTLDAAGVGRLVCTAVKEGRAARRDLKIGICGEHGGDPASVDFCDRAGLDYVSCSPFRVPVARLAAAQAAIRAERGAG